jgi:hypothetical protein
MMVRSAPPFVGDDGSSLGGLLVMIGPSGLLLRPNKLWFGLLALVSCILAGAVSAQAQQFSADLVAAQDNVTAAPVGRLRVLGDKVRLETSEVADGFFLIDGAKAAAYFVRPRAREFMDARQSSRLALTFVTVDPDDPCRQWQAMAQQAGLGEQNWRCERIGEETIEGRNTIAWRTVAASGRQLSGWIDRERRFPLRVKTEDGTIVTAGHVRDEPQPAELFQIPSGFRKFDPQLLIDRIKQSDVWVAD